MRLPAAFNGGKSSCRSARGLQNLERTGAVASVGSTPFLSAKLFERSVRFELVFARFIPIRRMARRANPRLPNRTFARHPFVLAPIAFIPFLLNGDHCHVMKFIR